MPTIKLSLLSRNAVWRTGKNALQVAGCSSATQSDVLPESSTHLDPSKAQDRERIGRRGRMRERLLMEGGGKFTDEELLEMVIVAARPKGTPGPVAEALIQRFGTFRQAVSAEPEELSVIPGMTGHIIALFSLIVGTASRRAQTALVGSSEHWGRLADYFVAAIAHRRVEVLLVLVLDASGRYIGCYQLGCGTINHVPVYPREVAHLACRTRAASLIVAHNHPSGDSTPSLADLEMTVTLERALLPLGITLKDHVIVGKSRCTSLKRDGWWLPRGSCPGD